MDNLNNKAHDIVSVPRSEYKELLEKAERLNTVKRLIEADTYINTDLLLTVVGRTVVEDDF